MACLLAKAPQRLSPEIDGPLLIRSYHSIAWHSAARNVETRMEPEFAAPQQVSKMMVLVSTWGDEEALSGYGDQ
jgi:hypothetical protein